MVDTGGAPARHRGDFGGPCEGAESKVPEIGLGWIGSGHGQTADGLGGARIIAGGGSPPPVVPRDPYPRLMAARDHDPEPSALAPRDGSGEVERSLCGGCSGLIIRWLHREGVWTEWRHE